MLVNIKQYRIMVCFPLNHKDFLSSCSSKAGVRICCSGHLPEVMQYRRGGARRGDFKDVTS